MSIQYKNLKTPILIDSLNISDELSKSCINRAYEIGDEMSRLTNLKADMSTYGLHKKEKIIYPLLDIIIDKIKKEFPLDIFPYVYNKSKIFNVNYIIEDSWFSIYRENDFAIKHNHCYSREIRLAFCFYLQADEYSSPLYFEELDYSVQPYKNMLICFPSFVNHSVEKQINKSNDRVILAGNISL